jgi:2-polyprenyl-6-hydroxyphenyl methylase/3-demethylubiquinone-9 3-methyltransferase
MTSTIDSHEIENFSALSDQWWDTNGPMKPLHKLNPTRLDYIKSQICAHFDRDDSTFSSLDNLKLLDVGCGAGLICEPMARLGAEVTGLDASNNNINVAQEHATQSMLDITYLCDSIENQATKKTRYDVILALEIIEHVADIPTFIHACMTCLKPGGIIIFSTLNRTPKSYALGILAAEYVLRWVPRGTHQWKKFVKPSEIVREIEKSNGQATDLCGLTYNPLKDIFLLNKNDLAVNYFLTAVRNS